MDFELGTDQVALQEAIRKQLDAQYPMTGVRALEASDGLDRARWRQLGDAGVFALRVAEAEGGVGLGSAEAVLVFEELGRALVPGPLVASHLASGLVDGAAGGDTVVGVLERTGDGHPVLVEHLAALDVLVVVEADGV